MPAAVPAWPGWYRATEHKHQRANGIEQRMLADGRTAHQDQVGARQDAHGGVHADYLASTYHDAAIRHGDLEAG
ncbi:hypothetical protein [Mycobacterium asiaticum]|uniref:hypothetical protein n=1 Tax=Mycobacterium asiaticum TaxID=1790 RepID=UPI001154B36B|nr:hypothetical protein [Mycobacterium asiaticum]